MHWGTLLNCKTKFFKLVICKLRAVEYAISFLLVFTGLLSEMFWKNYQLLIRIFKFQLRSENAWVQIVQIWQKWTSRLCLKKPFFTCFSKKHYRKALQVYKSIVHHGFKSLLLAVKWRPFPFVAIHGKNIFSLANTVKVKKHEVILSIDIR